jgi:putative nucleotidyltransferase with HDIG domain
LLLQGTEIGVGERHGSSGVLLVIDRPPTPAHLNTAKSLGAEPVRLEDFRANLLDTDPSIVFDIDLRRVENIRKLKGSLARRGRGCRIFLVDPDSRLTVVHANVLGADSLLPRPATVAEMNAALHKHFGIKTASLDDEALMQSIDAGVVALDRSFASLTSDAELDTDGIIDASGRIADAVSGLGIDDWLATVKGYHIGTFQHCMLVTGVAAAFGCKTGMAKRDIVRLTVAGLLHDIGKAAVPIAILDKPSALTDEEVAILRKHPVTGFDYLTARSTVAAEALSSVRHHHEYLDGSGYPDGLVASEIGDVTRIITICDIYAALVERRSYKEPKSPAQAVMILNAMAQSGKLEMSLVRELGRIMVPRSS